MGFLNGKSLVKGNTAIVVIWHEWGFVLPSLAGRATSFVLKQKEAKIQDDNDPSARRASTRLGVLVGPALVTRVLWVRGN